MKTVKFLTAVTAVRCEKPARVTLAAGVAYPLLALHDARRAGDVIVNVADPEATYLGGDGGVTKLPCTLRVQVPAGQVTVERE